MSSAGGKTSCFGTWTLVAVAFAGLAAVDTTSHAETPEQTEDDRPRQVVTERSPVRSNTTFAYRFRRVEATLEDGEDQVRLFTRALPADDGEYRAVTTLVPGAPLRLLRSPVIKLTTTTALVFPGHAHEPVTLPVGNVAANYLGAYGVWLRRNDSGWELVFNDQADAWGSQYDPDTVRSVVPASYTRHPGGTSALKGSLEGGTDEALLRIEWGEHQWTAAFHVAGAEGARPR